jgi:hypothetical protein
VWAIPLPGWTCDLEGQYCPPQQPGSSGEGYCCSSSKWTPGVCGAAPLPPSPPPSDGYMLPFHVNLSATSGECMGCVTFHSLPFGQALQYVACTRTCVCLRQGVAFLELVEKNTVFLFRRGATLMVLAHSLFGTRPKNGCCTGHRL